MRRRVLLALLAASAAFSAGCQRWQLDPQALSEAQPERRRLEVWSGGQRILAHGVEVVGDSVRVVPYWRPPRCDSCVRWLARSAVDSVRVRTTDDLLTALAAGAGAVLLVLALLFVQQLQGLKT